MQALRRQPVMFSLTSPEYCGRITLHTTFVIISCVLRMGINQLMNNLKFVSYLTQVSGKVAACLQAGSQCVTVFRYLTFYLFLYLFTS